MIEIRSRNDRWKDVALNVAEYLSADVLTVAVVDPLSQRVHVYSADNETRVLSTTDLLTFPEVVPGFEIAVGRLFD